MEQYDEALLAYRKVLKSKSSLKANYETRLQIGLVLERQKNLNEALKVYNDILKEKLLKSFEPEVQIKRGIVYDLDHPERGRVQLLGSPVKLGESPVEHTPAPLHGQHTLEVYREVLGLSEDQVGVLREGGIV